MVASPPGSPNPFEFASGEDNSQYCQPVSAPARIALSKETEERKETIRRKVAEESSTEL